MACLILLEAMFQAGPSPAHSKPSLYALGGGRCDNIENSLQQARECQFCDYNIEMKSVWLETLLTFLLEP